MGSGWSEEKFADYKLQLNTKQNCLTVWELIELLGMGYFSKGMNPQTLSMGITEVFLEFIMDVLKQVRQHIDPTCTVYTGVPYWSLPPHTFLQLGLDLLIREEANKTIFLKVSALQ